MKIQDAQRADRGRAFFAGLTGLGGVLSQAGVLMLSLSSPRQEDTLAELGEMGQGVVGGRDTH